jgi:ATP-binding cassette subfamily B (MDR/TAP) protein 10
VDSVLGLARKEAYMTGIFWGMSGLTGNLALLCLLGYGESSLWGTGPV